MNDFEINRHGQMVFPLSSAPHVRCDGLGTLEDVIAVVRREYEERALPPEAIARRAEDGAYASRYDLLVNLARSVYWADRYWSPLFTKVPTRWADVPLASEHVFLAELVPWAEREATARLIRATYDALPPCLARALEDTAFRLLFDIVENMAYDPSQLSGVPRTAREVINASESATLVLTSYDPAFPVFAPADVHDFTAEPPEATALMRWAMVAHNQHPWDRAETRLRRVADLREDELVVVLRPRDDVRAFLPGAELHAASPQSHARRPIGPSTTRGPATAAQPAAAVRTRITACIAALAVTRGEYVCSNTDIVRNAAIGWSPMTSDDIAAKTGIVERRYTSRSLEDLVVDVAARALDHSRVATSEIGGVIVCTATNRRLMPSMAAWITGELGIASCGVAYDLVAACAGFPYGIAAAGGLLNATPSPVLVIWADKFSDKLGGVRSSRMIFADGAAAAVLVPARSVEESDIHLVTTYAGGPGSEVNAVTWPNPRFGMSVTVDGDGARSIVHRYLRAMVDELRAMPDPANRRRSMLDAIDLVVPHQANEAMLVHLAESVGVERDRVYFNIAHVGNTAAASIPIAIHDAVADGLVHSDTRLLAAGFGAGATAGYVLLTVDPAAVAPDPAYAGSRSANRALDLLAGAR
jgi:3-oxoacyl-[acyl-carrier-protein] synthase-3